MVSFKYAYPFSINRSFGKIFPIFGKQSERRDLEYDLNNLPMSISFIVEKLTDILESKLKENLKSDMGSNYKFDELENYFKKNSHSLGNLFNPTDNNFFGILFETYEHIKEHSSFETIFSNTLFYSIAHDILSYHIKKYNNSNISVLDFNDCSEYKFISRIIQYINTKGQILDVKNILSQHNSINLKVNFYLAGKKIKFDESNLSPKNKIDLLNGIAYFSLNKQECGFFIGNNTTHIISITPMKSTNTYYITSGITNYYFNDPNYFSYGIAYCCEVLKESPYNYMRYYYKFEDRIIYKNLIIFQGFESFKAALSKKLSKSKSIIEDKAPISKQQRINQFTEDERIEYFESKINSIMKKFDDIRKESNLSSILISDENFTPEKIINNHLEEKLIYTTSQIKFYLNRIIDNETKLLTKQDNLNIKIDNLDKIDRKNKEQENQLKDANNEINDINIERLKLSEYKLKYERIYNTIKLKIKNVRDKINVKYSDFEQGDRNIIANDRDISDKLSNVNLKISNLTGRLIRRIAYINDPDSLGILEGNYSSEKIKNFTGKKVSYDGSLNYLVLETTNFAKINDNVFNKKVNQIMNKLKNKDYSNLDEKLVNLGLNYSELEKFILDFNKLIKDIYNKFENNNKDSKYLEYVIGSKSIEMMNILNMYINIFDSVKNFFIKLFDDEELFDETIYNEYNEKDKITMKLFGIESNFSPQYYAFNNNKYDIEEKIKKVENFGVSITKFNEEAKENLDNIQKLRQCDEKLSKLNENYEKLKNQNQKQQSDKGKKDDKPTLNENMKTKINEIQNNNEYKAKLITALRSMNITFDENKEEIKINNVNNNNLTNFRKLEKPYFTKDGENFTYDKEKIKQDFVKNKPPPSR